jgi:intein/homing endonuclease
MPAYTCHVLYIHNRDSVRKFAENIRFISKAKQCRIEGYVPERIQHIYHGCNFEKTIDKGDYFVGKQINNVALVRIKSVTQIGVKRVYNLTANTTHTYIANGFVGGNTGGAEDSNFEGLKEMFYNGQAYNVKMLPNV